RLHNPTLKAVKERFARLGYTQMPESNVGQALVPEDFKVLKNDRGTAPGLLYHSEGKTFVIVAGVPSEMEFVMETGVLPFLEKQYKGKLEAVLHRTLYTAGVGESSLAELVGDPKEFLGTNTALAFLPRAGSVRMRIDARARTKAKAQKEIDRVEHILRERAGRFIFGMAEEKIEEYLVRALTKQHKSLSTAESCTGGLIASMITKVVGASEVFRGGIVSYHNGVKSEQLGVRNKTLEVYGAVSEETACEMAEGALERLKTDFALSTTGIAGPTGATPGKPIGTVWIALAERGKPTVAKRLQGDFGREMNTERSASAALELLRKRLTK
ncbi:MAG TPA: nicotinamide-nucleotide amidohydrolase family protein, partial [Candidatus Kapabacteria bacterium]